MERGSVRLAELLAALATATDLGMGQPAGHAVQTALLSVQLARALGASEVRVAHTPIADPEPSMAASMAVHCEAAGMLGSRLALVRT